MTRRTSGKRYFIHTTGCKANQWDALVMERSLGEAGLRASELAAADFVIVNACTLTEGAVRDIRRFFNRARRANPSSKLILAGCHGQVYGGENLGADLVLGHEEKFRVPEFLEARGLHRSIPGGLAMEPLADLMPRRTRTRFFLKIQDGCDRYCTYCVVPFARGAPRSRDSAAIIHAMGVLRERGVKEVVLTGIEIASYRDPATGMRLPDLLALLEGSETPPRIRISSIDPLAADEDLLATLAASKKIARSLHLPLQSGSDRVLKRMGRRYGRRRLEEILERTFSRIDGIGIGCDIITGFPGEEESDFRETLDLVTRREIYYLHVFPFSARPGTAAAVLRETVPPAVKKERTRILRALDRERREAFYGRFAGTEAVIIPEPKIYHSGLMRGFSDNYIPVFVPGEKALANRLTKVTIREIKDGMPLGEVVL